MTPHLAVAAEQLVIALTERLDDADYQRVWDSGAWQSACDAALVAVVAELERGIGHRLDAILLEPETPDNVVDLVAELERRARIAK